MADEFSITFDCAGEELVGVIHAGHAEATVGIVFVVGGPQYRVGSHRQFVIMARALAARGYPVLRFDHRGMGDSLGDRPDFMKLGPDIRAAIDCLQQELANVPQVVILGLCDGASAAMVYSPTDDRVVGQILMNPWVRTRADSEKARLRHYYLPQLLRKSFWIKVVTGQSSLIESLTDLFRSLRIAVMRKYGDGNAESNRTNSFVESILSGMNRFKHHSLFLLSGSDLVAMEFLALCKADPRWQTAVGKSLVTTMIIVGADHTMSSRKDLDRTVEECSNWMSVLRSRRITND